MQCPRAAGCSGCRAFHRTADSFRAVYSPAEGRRRSVTVPIRASRSSGVQVAALPGRRTARGLDCHGSREHPEKISARARRCPVHQSITLRSAGICVPQRIRESSGDSCKLTSSRSTFFAVHEPPLWLSCAIRESASRSDMRRLEASARAVARVDARSSIRSPTRRRSEFVAPSHAQPLLTTKHRAPRRVSNPS